MLKRPILAIVLWSIAASTLTAMVFIFSSEQASSPCQQQSYTEGHNVKNKPLLQITFPDPISFFNFSLVIVTLCLVVIAIKQANAAKAAADVAKQTLVTTQRAWIRAKVGIGNVPLFDQNGARVSISFEITNVGNAPALNITPHAWLIVGKRGQFPIAEQQRKFDEIRRQPFLFGFTLFPGEDFPDAIDIGLYSVTRDEIEEGFRFTNGAYISLYVIGCIDYTFPIDADTPSDNVHAAIGEKAARYFHPA
jgi:hypothetical protein